jgi:beta-xylosidase
MKQICSMIAMTLFISACGGTGTIANKPGNSNVTEIKPANTLTAGANSAANTNSAEPVVGARIESESVTKLPTADIPAGWSFIDPDGRDSPSNLSVKDGMLTIAIPSQKDLFGENRSAPRLLKAIKGDFQIETRVRFDPKEDYQGAGLLLFFDGNNYVRLERAFGGLGGGESGIRLDARTSEGYQTVTNPSQVPTTAKEVDLKLVRGGKSVTAYWRLDEEGEWKDAGQVEDTYPESTLAGVLGCNTAAPISASFAYIILAPVGK